MFSKETIHPITPFCQQAQKDVRFMEQKLNKKRIFGFSGTKKRREMAIKKLKRAIQETKKTGYDDALYSAYKNLVHMLGGSLSGKNTYDEQLADTLNRLSMSSQSQYNRGAYLIPLKLFPTEAVRRLKKNNELLKTSITQKSVMIKTLKEEKQILIDQTKNILKSARHTQTILKKNIDTLQNNNLLLTHLLEETKKIATQLCEDNLKNTKLPYKKIAHHQAIIKVLNLPIPTCAQRVTPSQNKLGVQPVRHEKTSFDTIKTNRKEITKTPNPFSKAPK